MFGLLLENIQQHGTYYIHKKYKILAGTDTQNKAGSVTIYTGDNKTLIKTIANTTEKSNFIIKQDGFYNIHLRASDNIAQGNAITIRFYDLMLLQQDTDYIKHEEQIIAFPLKPGQRLHKGDYLAPDGIHNVRKQAVINGTEENWLYFSADAKWARPYLMISDKKLGEGDNRNDTVLCNKMKCVSWSTGRAASNNDYGVFTYSGDRRISFLIKKEEMSSLDVAGAKKYFQNNNMIVEYNLENEEIEEYTEEQQAVYNKLQKLLLYKHYNYIECIDEVNCKMKLTYRPDMLLSLEARIETLETATSEVNT